MTHVQEFLRSGGTLAELAAKYAIKATPHKVYPNLVLLKYHQIDSPFIEPMVRECRGIILDRDDNWRVIAYPFKKFFNYGEGHAAEIDWSTARVQEKLDGSLCTIYYYDNKWHVATSGMPDGAGEVNGCGFSFAELFWRIFEAMDLPKLELTDLNFMFELTSPWNRVVVPHKEERLTLIGVRNRVTGQEQPVDDWRYMYPVVKSFPLQSLDNVLSTFEHMDPLHQEGYVIVDGNFNRIKVKHPGYVAIHHIRDGFGPKRILEVIRSGETSELLTYYPEWKPEFDRIQALYDKAVSEVESDYERLKGIELQKDFALEAVKTMCSAALFTIRKNAQNGKAMSVRQYFADMTINRLMEMLHVKDVAQEIV